MQLGKQIADQRKSLGYSQEELAQISGISLRTIQRIEKQTVQPRGHTLRKLAESLQIEHSSLSTSAPSANEALKQTRKLNTLGLMVILLPLLSIFIQVLFWRRHKSELENYLPAKKILSFQIVWIIVLIISLAAAHALTYLLTGQSVYGHFPLRLSIYSILVAINVFTILRTSLKLNQNSEKILFHVPSLV